MDPPFDSPLAQPQSSHNQPSAQELPQDIPLTEIPMIENVSSNDEESSDQPSGSPDPSTLIFQEQTTGVGILNSNSNEPSVSGGIPPGIESMQNEAITPIKKSPLSDQCVGHFQLNLADRVGDPIDKSTVATIGSLIHKVSSDPPQISGLEIFFLPPIHGENDNGGSRLTTLLDDPAICRELTQHLRLDPLFLTAEAWNSNGFVMRQQGWGRSRPNTYSHMTRFLIKFLKDKRFQVTHTPAYAWLFLAFSILWLQQDDGKISCVLVCYDDSNNIKEQILGAFKDYPIDNIKKDPFAIYDALLRAIVMKYDEALWLFREPIRSIEKGRSGFAREIPKLLNQSLNAEQGVMGHYVRMAELSRHAIHMSETLEVAQQTVNSMLERVGPELHQQGVGFEGSSINTIAGLQFSAGLLANLKLRADAFVNRLENEIRLAYNIVSVHQLESTQRLLQESRDEEKDLITVVGQLTLVFLPATFVTGCWGMNFSATEDKRIQIAWTDIWMFFVTTIGTVLLCFILRACDFCHRRGLRCKPAENASPDGQASCQTCIEFGELCTRNRKAKKRGTKRLNANSSSESSEIITGPALNLKVTISSGNRKVVTELLDVYLDTVHPTFTLFCERELWVNWRDGSFPASASDYMNLVCMCALSALHANNRALFSDGTPTSETSSLAQTYLTEAETLIASCDETTGPVELIRSYGFLALFGAQSGNSVLIHKYLGLFHTISSRTNFHDEANWTTDINDCEKEVRRRLWWAMYRLEVHTACMFGSAIRCSETQCDVGYPSGLHHPAFVPGRDGRFEGWFSGWNLTTDLYRLLEHAVLCLRFRRRKQKSILQDYYEPDTPQIISRLSELQGQILPQFESVASRSSDSGRNRCGFQTCNIICTIHLARMMASIASQLGIETVCQAARDTMASMSSIPHEYIRATGSPLLQQLAGVGHMLLSTAKKDEATISHYDGFRETIDLIVDFLTRFSEFSQLAADAKSRLCTGLKKFDKHIQTLDTAAAIETDGSTNEVINPMSYLDLGLFDGAFDYQDFINGNLLKGFAWPDMG
ncbi:unnamed protein product [Fusarium equiseti]|uniref:Zn(2)-C6 fungal-type domain-containing protein n=1 Tax=Fusarium equiseti TaxID=61235 RepID=A0A8J2IJE5_FUSEQ|nr:unnamed protein product [Fusarium equiseti]